MTHISLSVTPEERGAMESFAKFTGLNLSEAIKKVFFERLEDEYDLKLIEEFEENDDGTRYSLAEIKAEFGIQ
ncbi:MAG: DUF6290 family protein [Defluviitaleaceae bacterium]|nr:DUF6290 family protein [Defluviitaleaceae bacterium]